MESLISMIFVLMIQGQDQPVAKYDSIIECQKDADTRNTFYDDGVYYCEVKYNGRLK